MSSSFLTIPPTVDRLQRRFDGLRADARHALFHFFEARGELRQRTFQRLRAALGFLAFGFLFCILDAVRQRGERLADFRKRVVGPPL